MRRLDVFPRLTARFAFHGLYGLLEIESAPHLTLLELRAGTVVRIGA